MKNKIFPAIFSALLLASFVSAQTGGSFTIEQSVIASGGETVANGSFIIQNTTGQAVAGDVQGGSFSISGGFIAPPFVPTAASATVSGRILTPDGAGLTNAVIKMTDASGNVCSVRSSSFGFYRFDDVAVGETYVFQIVSRRYQFAPQVVSVTEEIADLDFTAFQ